MNENPVGIRDLMRSSNSLFGVAVGVDKGHHGDAQLPGFGDSDVLLTGVDNDGCMDSITKVGNAITINIVTGNMSSEYTQGTILVRIRYANGFSGVMGQTAVIGT